MLERCQECLAQKSSYKLDGSVFSQVDAFRVRSVEIVDDCIDYARQQLIIVVVEHTDVVYQNLGIADRLLGDLCVNYKFIEGCVQHKHQGHLKLERKLWLRRSIRACELQRDLHVIQVLVAKYDTSGG